MKYVHRCLKEHLSATEIIVKNLQSFSQNELGLALINILINKCKCSIPCL